MSTHIWIRAETKPLEQRVALVPADAAKLIAAGFRVTAEESSQRAIPIGRYAEAGCEIAAENSWAEAAPDDAFILGVKDLPDNGTPLRHKHIYFGHVYKDQPDWQDTLGRFPAGGGTLFDLEFLTNEDGRRIAAFGYWAGYAGAAVAVATWCGQRAGNQPPLAPITAYPSREPLLAELSAALAGGSEKPDMLVIGALGRSGSGAVDLAESLGLSVTKWDMAETASGGPFPEIRRHSIFVNCILASPGCPRFVGPEDADASDRRLSVVSDVSCDPGSIYNPIPIYDRSTEFDNPTLRVREGATPLDIVAIDHLPSMLPMESSEDFSSQLLPGLLTLDNPKAGVWGRALEVFEKNVARL